MMGEEERSPLKANNRYEFGGPIGVLVLMFLLPATLYMVNLACRKVSMFDVIGYYYYCVFIFNIGLK